MILFISNFGSDSVVKLQKY